MVVVDWSKSMTCLHFHILISSKYDIPKYILCFRWLYAQFMNTRLVMMSVSLHTQTVLHCLIIQVLYTRVWFLNVQHTSLISVHTNLEHGLAILTESFSPLKLVLHNLSCWSPKQKWRDKPHYSYFVIHATTRLIWFELVPTSLNSVVKCTKCLVENSIVVLTLS